MKLQTFAQIYPESIQKLNADYPTDMTVLVRSINQVGMNLNQLAANNVSLAENLACSTQIVSTYYGKRLTLKNSSSNPPKVILVGRVQAPSNCLPSAQRLRLLAKFLLNLDQSPSFPPAQSFYFVCAPLLSACGEFSS